MELNAVVTKKIDASPELMILHVALLSGGLPSFTPGQFAVLGLSPSSKRCELSDPEEKTYPEETIIKRAYSISSSSIEKEYLEFYITLIRSGALTPRLFAVEIGSTLWLSPKAAGLFSLDDAPDDMNIILIATGTGLAPYMSMIRSNALTSKKRRVAIIHGARHSWDLGYQSELSSIQRFSSHFTCLSVISRPNEEPVKWSGLSGYVQDVWKEGHLEKAWGMKPAPDNTHIFLCGNPLMIEDMLNNLETEGFKEHTKKSPGEIHIERYW